jgi:hypothetical protein
VIESAAARGRCCRLGRREKQACAGDRADCQITFSRRFSA